MLHQSRFKTNATDANDTDQNTNKEIINNDLTLKRIQ